MPDFDINSIAEDQRPALEAHIQAQITSANKALESNRNDVLSKYTSTKEAADSATSQVEQYRQSFGDMTPEEIGELIQAKNTGDVQKLLGEGKLEEAARAQADQHIKNEQRQWDAKFKNQSDSYAELEARFNESDKQNRENRLGKTGTETFLKLDDHAPTALGDIHAAVLARFTLDETGEPIAYEKDGKTVSLDPKGNPLTIEYFVSEDLRNSKPHYYTPKQGSDARGSGGGTSKDFGLNISQRMGATSQTRASFWSKGREDGLDDDQIGERWQAIPWESK